MPYSRWTLITLLVLALVGVCMEAASGEIQPAAHNAGVAGVQPVVGSAETVSFSQQPARVGDRAAQALGVEMTINTSITQSGQQANTGKNTLQRRQQRFVEVLEVDDGRVRRAHVSYPLSRLTSTENDQPGQENVQAVEQKSYFVTREGQRLIVTDAEGSIPSQAEYEIVVTGLQNLGLPNPLIKHLVGKTMRVGDRMTLPRDIAEQLMGFGGEFGRVEQFELQLKSVQQIEGQQCAVFNASIIAVGEVANPIRIHAFGEVAIETETCRTVSAEISGPLTLSVAEHTPQGSFQYKAQGTMRFAVKSKYGHARQ